MSKNKKYDLNSTLLIGTKYTSTVSIKYIHKWFLKPLIIKPFLFLFKVFLFCMSLKFLRNWTINQFPTLRPVMYIFVDDIRKTVYRFVSIKYIFFKYLSNFSLCLYKYKLSRDKQTPPVHWPWNQYQESVKITKIHEKVKINKATSCCTFT